MGVVRFAWPRVEPDLGFIVEARHDFIREDEVWRDDFAWARGQASESMYEGQDNDLEGRNPFEPFIVNTRIPREGSGAPRKAAVNDHLAGLEWSNPMEKNGRLWLAFSEVDDEAGLLRFVKRFGPMIGRNEGVGELLELKEPLEEGWDYYGDSVASCLNAGIQMYWMREAWKSLGRKRYRDALQKLGIEATQDDLSPAELEDWAYGRFLQDLNQQLHFSNPYVVRGRSGFTQLILPDSLRAAAWAEFARAVCGNVDWGECQTCGELFELDPRQTRKDRKYCSNACKQKAWRDRKAQEGVGT